ncbi:MAG TPA: hypothetical protein VGM67_03330 [Gemmatimonadaceae bacterium]|jgi:hypothetical protein
MRVFSDSNGTEWTVYEVKKSGGVTERWSYLPAEFGDGWLCFESDYTKRRLTPIPEKWREFSDKQLTSLLGQATTVNRSRPSVDDRSPTD